MGKKRRQNAGHSSDSSASDVSADGSSPHGRYITKIPLKKTHSVSANVSDTLLPAGTQSMELIVTKSETDLENQQATYMKDNKKIKSSTVVGQLASQDPITVIMTGQQDVTPSFNIYDSSRKVSPVFDRKPSLNGNKNLDRNKSDSDRLTPPFARVASRSGSGDFGAISPSGSLIDDNRIYEEGQSPVRSEGEMTEHEDDLENEYHHRSDSEREREHSHDEREEDGNGETRRLSLARPESDTGFVLQFSLAKVLAHKATTRMRKNRVKKATKYHGRLGVPNIDLMSKSSSSDAALEVRLEHEESEHSGEVKPKKTNQWSKILVSLWPMGQHNGCKADFIPLDIQKLTLVCEYDSEINEDVADSDGLQQKVSAHEEGQSHNEHESTENVRATHVAQPHTGNEPAGVQRMESLRGDRRRSSYDRHYSVVTEHGITRFDSKQTDAVSSRRGSESIAFMNLVRDFMEDTLIKSYRQPHSGNAEIETPVLLRQNLARERAIAVVKATAVQCDDMFDNMTDEEMISHIIVRHVIKNAVALEKELEYQENMDTAAKAVAEEILAQIDENVESVSQSQRHFSICVELPLMETLYPSEVKLQVEYLSDVESEAETTGKTSHKETRVNGRDKTEPLKLRMWKPLPPIGGRKDTEDIGLIDPATSCDSKIILSSMAGRERPRGQKNERPHRLLHRENKGQSATDGVSQPERRSLRCYDGVTRVMASLATQTDDSLQMESDSHRHHQPEEARTRHSHRPDGSHKHECDRKVHGQLHAPGVTHSHSGASVRSTRSSRLTQPPLSVKGSDRKAVPSSSKLRDHEEIPNLQIPDFSEDDGETGKSPRKVMHPLLTEVGPPHILKYKKESVPQLHVEEVSHMDKAFISYNSRFNWIQGGVFHGNCDFCKQHILPYPTDAERQQAKEPEKLFCCHDYKQFVHTLISNTEDISEDAIRCILKALDVQEGKTSPELIDIRSQQQKFSGNKEVVQAKIRATERMRERELVRQQKAIEKGPVPDSQKMGVNFHRNQTKTVATMSFSLSASLSSTVAAGSFPVPSPGLYQEKDQRRSRRPSADEQQYADYHRRPSGRAKERLRSRRQSGNDPHFSEYRQMMTGHHLEMYTRRDESNRSHDSRIPRRSREARHMRQMQRSRELSQPKNASRGFIRHPDHLHPHGASGHRRRSVQRQSTNRSRSKNRRYSSDGRHMTGRRHSTDKGHSSDRRHSTDSHHVGAGRHFGDRRQRAGDRADSDIKFEMAHRGRRNAKIPPRHIYYQFLKNINAPPWPSADTEHFEIREGRLQPKVANYSEMVDLEPEPVLPPWAVSEVCDGQMLDIDALRQTKTLVTKYYPHGKLFVILFPDGTGSVFYPSGKLAITISSVTFGFYTYIIQDKHGNIMGVFDGQGHAYTNYQNTKLRLCLDQKGGLELDWRGGQKRKWNWRGQEEHVHAPPLQPITFAVTKHAAVRLMAQDNITLTFNCWSRACRFQVGAKLKVPKNFVAHKEPLDEVALMRNETKTSIEAILDRIANLLKFPHCTNVDKMALPLFIRATIERQEHMRAVLQATAKGLDVQSSIFVN